MRSFSRKQTPRVVDGRVQKKNNWSPSPEFPTNTARYPRVIRERAGIGYRHVLFKKDVERFVALLPDWDELSVGLEAIILARGEDNTAGYHSPGIVGICAWNSEIVQEVSSKFFDEHEPVYRQLGIPRVRLEDGYRLEFLEATARAYQLVHIFLHELGHHRDRMTTRSRNRASRGEPFAEKYALAYGDLIWSRFLDEFGLPEP